MKQKHRSLQQQELDFDMQKLRFGKQEQELRFKVKQQEQELRFKEQELQSKAKEQEQERRFKEQEPWTIQGARTNIYTRKPDESHETNS